MTIGRTREKAEEERDMKKRRIGRKTKRMRKTKERNEKEVQPKGKDPNRSKI